MKIVFRVDASLEMGIGHVMRCLTLADALRKEGAQCFFVCREHPGNLHGQIVAQGYEVHSLPICRAGSQTDFTRRETTRLAYASWLGCDWSTDARQTTDSIGSQKADWLIVDHYALDARWEKQMRSNSRKVMVIDDLSDRNHDCDLLLDQTYGRPEEDYRQWVPVDCKLLVGAKYALLRPEFAELREYSLQRRKEPTVKHLLLSMGGIDKDNVTGKVLQALKQSHLPEDCRISVVMGKGAPWLEDVRLCAEELVWPTEVMVDVIDMAQLMADSDLAIGASGSTTWERCCLGVPTLMFVLAENQRTIANVLSEVKAAQLLDGVEEFGRASRLSVDDLKKMSRATSEITDGVGAQRVAQYLMERGGS